MKCATCGSELRQYWVHVKSPKQPHAPVLEADPSSPQVTPPKYDPSWHGSQAHTFVTDKPVGSEVKPRTGDKWFTYEDQLPADMPKEDYAAWYAKSWIIGGLGVRVGPVYPSDAEPRTGEGS